MKALIIAALSIVLFAAGVAAEEKKEMSEKEKLSYSIGYIQGSSMAGFFKNQNVDLDNNTVMNAFKAGFSGEKAALTDQEMHGMMNDFQKKMAAKQAEQIHESAEKNKKAGEAFLAENAKKKGVVTLPSGLQYKILTKGTGPLPKATDKVKVNYKGTLIDGTEFDSSYKRGEPAVFQADKVIPGWTEALQLMNTGSKWEVYIPAKLAYGDRGVGSVIGPDSVLVFEIELLSIEK